jgi:hypothetical protein
MGQYYMPTVISGDGKVATLYSHDYGNGLKLMEHSYIGNDFVNAVASLIWKTPKQIAWIGDYSDEYGGDVYETKLKQEEFLPLYETAWGEGGFARVKPSPDGCNMESSNLFLVNHTQKQYIDLDEYCKQNRWEEKNSWDNVVYDMCINPLPLLTACGNGRGGGDYHSQYPDYDKVGLWAFDELEVTDIKPDYEKVMFTFKEEAA